MMKGGRSMDDEAGFYPEDHGGPLFLHKNAII